MTKSLTTKQKGDALESKVAVLYKSLGFDVIQNVRIGGSQIDLLASRYLQGVGKVTIMLEAKSRTGGKKSLGINEVRNFLTTAEGLLQSGLVQSAVLISDIQISESAQTRALEIQGVSLRTIQDVERDITYNTTELTRLVQSYQTSDIFKNYVPLNGTIVNGSIYPDVVTTLLDMAKAKQPLITVTGDFGSGKTTLAEHLHFTTANEFLQKKTDIYPYLLKLRGFLKFEDTYSFVNHTLRQQYNNTPTQSAFERQLSSGNLLIILDGFDEINTGATVEDRVNYLNKLNHLIGQGSPVVLTTRPTYFESFQELKKMVNANQEMNGGRKPNFEKLRDEVAQHIGIKTSKDFPIRSIDNIIRINGLTKPQIATLIKNVLVSLDAEQQLDADQIMNFILSVYNLEDLASRPILLEMIVATIVKSGIDIDDKSQTMGPFRLYELYTGLSAIRDQEKFETIQFLDQQKRLLVCEHIAMNMMESSSLVLAKPEVIEIIEHLFVHDFVKQNADTNTLVSRAFTDVSLCTFLAHEDDVGLKFTHKSYLEFFVAKHISQRINRSLEYITNLDSTFLTKEIVYFLGSHVNENEDFRNLVTAAIAENSASPDDNIDDVLRIFWTSGRPMSQKHLKGHYIGNAVLAKSYVFGLFLDKTELSQISIENSVLENWRQLGVNWKDVYIFQSNLIGGLAEIEITTSIVLNCTIDEAKVSIQSGQRHRGQNQKKKFDAIDLLLSSETDLTIEDTIITRSIFKFKGRALLRDVHFSDNCNIIIQDCSYIEGASEISFTDCTISVRRTDPLQRLHEGIEISWLAQETKVKFRKCEFEGVWLSTNELLALNSNSKEIQLIDCSGVIIFDNGRGTIGDRELANLTKKYPTIDFIDLTAISNAFVSHRTTIQPQLDQVLSGNAAKAFDIVYGNVRENFCVNTLLSAISANRSILQIPEIVEATGKN